MTPAEFFERFCIDPKALRRYLRQRWPHEHNSAWFLDERMVRDALDHFGVPSARRDKSPTPLPHTAQATGDASPQSPTERASLILALATQAIATLTDPSGAQPPARFPTDLASANRAGMYAWWAGEHARVLLGQPLGIKLPALIYVGQTGATHWPSGKPSDATLVSRIQTQHIRGNARSSTFRLTISALLLEELGLSRATSGGRLDGRSNSQISAWISAHLRVSIAPCDHRDLLSDVEAHVVRTLDPPLNLAHCPPTIERAKLSELRALIPRS